MEGGKKKGEPLSESGKKGGRGKRKEATSPTSRTDITNQKKRSTKDESKTVFFHRFFVAGGFDVASMF